MRNNLKTLNDERMFQKESEFLKKEASLNSSNKSLSNYTFPNVIN